MKELEINNLEENQRLDKYLLKYLNKSSKSYVYKMLRKKRIKLNNKRGEGSEILQKGDKVQMYISDETLSSFMEIKKISKTAGKVNIVFEDDNILICNKPAGVLSHAQKKEDEDTMIHRILLYLHNKGEYDLSIESTFTPALCNRLDRNTSGIIVCGKNLQSTQHLNKMFANRDVDKYYITIVKGVISESGTLKGYHAKNKDTNCVNISGLKHDGTTEAITKYKPIKASSNYTFLEIKLITGKTHQIRAHLQKINHEVVGDAKYGDKKTNQLLKEEVGLKNQLLHSEKIIFKDKEGFLSYLYNKEFKAPEPKIFKNILSFLFN
jgi:23S rRNA pseudouridine955/2504/2580 synthase